MLRLRSAGLCFNRLGNDALISRILSLSVATLSLFKNDEYQIYIMELAEMTLLTCKKSILSLFLGFCLLLSLPTMAKGNDVADAQNRVLNVTRTIVKGMEANKVLYKKNPAALTTMIRQQVLPFIDFDAMSKLTLGKHWRSASVAQRQRFTNAFREMLVRSYGKAMLNYTGANIRGGNSTPKRKAGYVTVRTVVVPKGGKPIAANYDVRKKGNDWKAYNVEIAGISLLTNFRTNFSREVSAKGLDALIARLERTKK